MITKIHNKLIRDKIPQFLKNKKYNIELKKNLIEEVNEYL
jgi:predicted house-cleaning noncanonical NTP pyrophosphatase (MazG superfamily)